MIDVALNNFATGSILFDRPKSRGVHNVFVMNTYKSVSKQMSLTTFRMNTCEKTSSGPSGWAV
jgi:hypothetical protein